MLNLLVIGGDMLYYNLVMYSQNLSSPHARTAIIAIAVVMASAGVDHNGIMHAYLGNCAWHDVPDHTQPSPGHAVSVVADAHAWHPPFVHPYPALGQSLAVVHAT